MELFTDSKPSLIGDKVTQMFDMMLKDARMKNKNLLNKFYDNIIYPNLGIFIIILIILGFLSYRYYTHGKQQNILQENNNRRHSNSNREKFFEGETQFVRGLNTFGGMDGPKEKMIRPTFNPTISVSQQESYVNYKPDEIMVNVGGTLKNNVKYSSYDTPQTTPNDFQYRGPYYRGVSPTSPISDDMLSEFIDIGQKNIIDYDYMIGEKCPNQYAKNDPDGKFIN